MPLSIILNNSKTNAVDFAYLYRHKSDSFSESTKAIVGRNFLSYIDFSDVTHDDFGREAPNDRKLVKNRVLRQIANTKGTSSELLWT